MDKDLTATITKVLTDQPIEFETRNRRYCLYPPTLGKLYLTAPIVEAIDIKKDNLTVLPFAEILRVVCSHREECCRLLAYHTLCTKEDCFNSKLLKTQTKQLSKYLDNEDIATLLITILKDDCTEAIVKGTGMQEDAERMRRVEKAKDKSSSFIFGGKTIWGMLIDTACERYGWTFDYVVWGISYQNLTLLLKDKITSVYLSDKERKRVHLPDRQGDIVNGDNREQVMRMVRESEARPS